MTHIAELIEWLKAYRDLAMVSALAGNQDHNNSERIGDFIAAVESLTAENAAITKQRDEYLAAIAKYQSDYAQSLFKQDELRGHLKWAVTLIDNCMEPRKYRKKDFEAARRAAGKGNDD